jgi:hypothetical protein
MIGYIVARLAGFVSFRISIVAPGVLGGRGGAPSALVRRTSATYPAIEGTVW